MIFEFPNINPSTMELALSHNGSRFDSMFNGTFQTVSRPGAPWIMSLTFTGRPTASIATLKAFLAKLEGYKHRFTSINFESPIPQLGVPSGSPIVSGSSQTGSSLSTSGWLASTTVLLAGDYFSVNGEYKIVTSDVVADVSGDATVNFSPSLRNSPPGSTPIITDNPTIKFILSDPNIGWSVDSNSFNSITVQATEDINE